MFDEVNICPYTGLRSFTEDESIYFKGREEHIEEATQLLEKNKFLMLTGASGDGKSSLVYAGIIPNARAGFLKASYTNWQIADFRPERDPLKNLASSISSALDIPSSATTESELGHGFSALVDLYKSSKRYIDESSTEWQEANDEERKILRRDSGNLLILVDQFEEFFTNPENYNRGTTSNDANLVLNLLLETSNQALEQGLPIYVVFTMRSDYIGQCAAFRGLPEYIGFSQFFVPRLNRKQLQEVIEEPAILSGNTISRRLTERLIHDVIEGVDQLPILQHALNQIWKAADEGNVELDLIHYAKVGGMPESELPEEDQQVFGDWFAALPQVIKECYHKPGLQKVLDTHANKIYVSAGYEFKKRTGNTIDDDDAHAIIKTAFTCLTKIDESRAVRNRMTLEEITWILNKQHLTVQVVSDTIAVFREAGNTFVKPFLSEEESSLLAPDTVLDITHESLIRNWEMLGVWAKEEYDKFMILKDFKQQVDRWLEHDKSWGFLLPIGSLTYFENWFQTTNPNPHWVNRYNELVTETAKNLDESTQIVQNNKDYLKRSGQKHAIARAVLKFGPKKIGLGLAIILLLFTTSFVVYDFIKEQNGYVLRQAIDQGERILETDLANLGTRASYLVNRERMNKGDAFEIINKISNPMDRLTLATSTAYLVNFYNRKAEGNDFVFESILFASNAAKELFEKVTSGQVPKAKYMAVLIELIDVADQNCSFNDREDIAQESDELSSLLGQLVSSTIRNPNSDINVKELNEALEITLNHHALSNEEIQNLVKILSPFEGAAGELPINALYARNKSIQVGVNQDKFTYNGLYQILGELYASMGDAVSAKRAVDTLIRYHPSYEDYSTDGYSIAGYFASYNHWQALDEYAGMIAPLFNIKPYEVYQRTADRLGLSSPPMQVRYAVTRSIFANVWANPILDRMSIAVQDQFYKQYHKHLISGNYGKDETSFALALFYKQQGVFVAARNQNRSSQESTKLVDSLFVASYSSYQQVSDAYKSEPVQTFLEAREVVPRSQLYLYPDYRRVSRHYEPRALFANYNSGAFLEFIFDNDLFNDFFNSRERLQLAVRWISEYKNAFWNDAFNFYMANDVSLATLEKLRDSILTHKDGENLNITLLDFLLAERYYSLGMSSKASQLAKKIQPIQIPGLLQERHPLMTSESFDLIKKVYEQLVLHNEYSSASNIMSGFTNGENKIRLYDGAAIKLFANGQPDLGMIFLDSAKEINGQIIVSDGEFFDYEPYHAFALFMSNDEENIQMGLREITVLNSFFRIEFGYRLYAHAMAFNKQYYEALLGNKQRSPEEELIRINALLQEQLEDDDTVWENFELNSDAFYLFTGFSFGG